MKLQTAKTDLFMGNTSLQRIHHFAVMSCVDSFVVTSGTVQAGCYFRLPPPAKGCIPSFARWPTLHSIFIFLQSCKFVVFVVELHCNPLAFREADFCKINQ